MPAQLHGTVSAEVELIGHADIPIIIASDGPFQIRSDGQLKGLQQLRLDRLLRHSLVIEPSNARRTVEIGGDDVRAAHHDVQHGSGVLV